MDHKAACLAQAAACRARAESDPVDRDYWVDESIKWLERAVQTGRRQMVIFEDNDAAAAVHPAAPTER